MKKFFEQLHDDIDTIAWILFSALCIFVSVFVVFKACNSSDTTAYADERDDSEYYYGVYLWDENPYIGELGDAGVWYMCSNNFSSYGNYFDSIVVSTTNYLPVITLNYHIYDTQHNFTVAFDSSHWTNPAYRYVSFPVPTQVQGANENPWIKRHLHFYYNPFVGDNEPLPPESDVLSVPTYFYFSSSENLLRWNIVPNADGYQVISNNMTYAIDVTSNFFEPSSDGLYKVRAYCNTSNGLVFSDWTNSINVSSSVQTSLDFRYSNNMLMWNRVSGASRYQIVYSPIEFPDNFVDKISNYLTSFADDFNYSPQFDGYYVVIAYSSNGTISQISSSIHVTATGNNQIYSQNPLLLFVQPVFEFMNYPFFGVSLNQVFGVVMFVLVASIFLKLFAGG